MKRILLALLACLPVSAFALGGDIDDNESTQDASCTSGLFFVGVEGTWGSGTLTAYFQDWDGNFEEIRVEGTTKTWTADFTENLDLSGPSTIRLTLAGATSPDLDYTIRCASKR